MQDTLNDFLVKRRMGPESQLLRKVREEMQELDKIIEECENIARNQKLIGNADVEDSLTKTDLKPG